MSPYSPFPGHRTFTRRIADFDVERDPTTGHRVPTFSEESIDGTLVEQFGDMPAFAAGVVMTQSAILFTQDTVAKLDQIQDGTKFYEVRQIEEKYDSASVLVYRACHLHRLELHVDDTMPGKKILTISADATNPTWGTTDPVAGAYEEDVDAEVEVEAIPEEGYTFTYWKLDALIVVNNPITIVMNANRTLRPVWSEEE
jgi:hypothetical protein